MATFEVLARTGTISAAAQELGVAPSAVSRRLKALEARLGTELVRRSTRALVLTAAGEAYLERSKALLRDIDGLEETMRHESLGIAGRIRLAAPLSFGLCALPDLLSDFLQAHPAVKLDLDLRDDQVDIMRGSIDVALRIGELPASSLMARKLADIVITTCASPGFAAAHGPFLEPQDLEGLPGLVYANRMRADVIVYRDKDGAEQRVTLTGGVTANNGDILAALAASGHGIYSAPRFIMKDRIERGELIELLPDTDFLSVPLHAVWPQTKHMPARVRLLIDALAAHFAGMERR